MAEGGKGRRFFPDAFKLEAVAAVRGGRPVSQVAAELGLPDRLVRGWLRWAEGRAASARARPTRRRRSRDCVVSLSACAGGAAGGAMAETG
jgi:transposase-like protein